MLVLESVQWVIAVRLLECVDEGFCHMDGFVGGVYHS